MIVGLSGLAGHSIVQILRVRYLFRGSVIDENGALELHFEGGDSLCIDSGPDAETLAFSDGWRDPFGDGVLSPENQEFVRTHGRWIAFDVSRENAYSDAVGMVRNVEVVGEGDAVTSLTIFAGATGLLIEPGADDLRVRFV